MYLLASVSCLQIHQNQIRCYLSMTVFTNWSTPPQQPFKVLKLRSGKNRFNLVPWGVESSGNKFGDFSHIFIASLKCLKWSFLTLSFSLSSSHPFLLSLPFSLSPFLTLSLSLSHSRSRFFHDDGGKEIQLEPQIEILPKFFEMANICQRPNFLSSKVEI